MTEPDIVFADEPTGDLDTKTEQEIMDLLTDLNERQGVTFMIVTHEQEVARRTRRIMQLRDGKSRRRAITCAGLITYAWAGISCDGARW